MFSYPMENYIWQIKKSSIYSVQCALYTIIITPQDVNILNILSCKNDWCENGFLSKFFFSAWISKGSRHVGDWNAFSLCLNVVKCWFLFEFYYCATFLRRGNKFFCFLLHWFSVYSINILFVTCVLPPTTTKILTHIYSPIP